MVVSTSFLNSRSSHSIDQISIPTACFDAALGKTRAKTSIESSIVSQTHENSLYAPEKLHQSEPMWEFRANERDTFDL